MESPKYQTSGSEAALRLKAIIDTAIDGIITIDERGIIETINPAAARLFGYQPQEVIGRNISVLMPSPYRQEHDQYLDRYIETGVPHIIGIGREVEGLHKDGTIFPLRLAVSEVMLSDKRIFTGIIHDLTQVKMAEANVLRLNKELEDQNRALDEKVTERTEKLANAVDQLLLTNKRLEKEIEVRQAAESALRESESELKAALEKEKELGALKSRFVSMASHEFRTPLSTILSSVELIEAFQKAGRPDKSSKHINRIKNAVKHLTTVLNDILSLSKLEAGEVRPEMENFSFREFFQEVMDDVQGQLKPGQQLRHNDDYDDREVHLDKRALRHILFNLLSNASKYSAEGKPIDCRVKFGDEQLHITIQDHGIGIPKPDQKHLFRRFFRAQNVENIPGTGLGLNIVRHYVDLLGGSIELESELGKGAVFYVHLPL